MTDSIDSILDETLDDLADLPEYKIYPAGAHRVLASFGMKEINGKNAVTLDFKYISVEELAEPETEENPAPKAGDEAGTMFMLDNEFGVGNFKKCSKPFGEALGFNTGREIIEGVKDVECVILTSIRTNKKDPDDIKHYLNVKEIAII